jgi:protein-L-isoaspartate(D-aspartate) O-methyltransferase
MHWQLGIAAIGFILALGTSGPGTSPAAAADNGALVGNGTVDSLGSADDLSFALAQANLAEEVAAEMLSAIDRLALGRFDGRIIDVMRNLPRHHFVPEVVRPYAYLNQALPVGHGQTVSQPFVVAMMSQVAHIKPGDRVLLVSVGGGYHAALLHRLGADLRVMEMLGPVAESARKHLAGLEIDIPIRTGDGYYGWAEAGPYDAIIVRQAVHHLPGPLLHQLKPGGRLVMPVGPADAAQDLTVAEVDGNGKVHQRKVMPVLFTTLPGGDRI